VFLTAAVTTVVLVRAFLIVTGYPKVGGGGLHIAHVLWGGLLMGAAIVVALVSPGSRSQARAARLGGVGFGLFIDEVGKFLTKDVNYFFRPAIAIIYVVFVGFYLVVREVLLHQPLTDRQRLAIASAALTDLSLGQLGSGGRQHALALLDDVRSHRDLASSIRQALVAEPPRRRSVDARVTVLRERALDRARTAMAHRQFDHGLAAVVVLQAIVSLGQVALVAWHPQSGSSQGSIVTIRGAELASGIGAAYTLAGVVLLWRGDRAATLRVLLRSVLVMVFVTQVFVFAEYQASGVVGLLFELVVLALLRLAGDARPDAFAPPVSG
jgi:hypothetical protein